MFISVEIVFADDKLQKIIPVSADPLSCIADVIYQSGILSNFPTIDLDKNKVGIFGKLCSLDTKVREGDRIEIYRPLSRDPKKIRRNRAKKQQSLAQR